MKRILLDANVILDLIDSKRSGHQDALALEESLERRGAKILCAWHSLLIIEDIGRKAFGAEHIHTLLNELLASFEIPKTGTEDAIRAFQYLDQDYEDALQITASLAGSAEVIITSDRSGFTKSPIPVMLPLQFTQMSWKD
jgi:predicted nucleic acid-binding protein